MTNKEFLDTLLITGKVTRKDLYSSLGNYNKYFTHVQTIVDSKKFIGNIYRKFMLLPNISNSDILFILGMLVLSFDFSDKEIDILIRRFRLIKLCTNLKYDVQSIQIQKALIEGKSVQTELYKCKLFTGAISIIYLYNVENGIELYKLAKDEDRLDIYNASNDKLLCGDVNYVLVSEKGFKIVSNSEYNRSIYIRDRYKFKIC